jgi:ribonuclease P protein component
MAWDTTTGSSSMWGSDRPHNFIDIGPLLCRIQALRMRTTAGRLHRGKENVPAAQYTQKESTRLPCPHGHKGRTGCPSPTAGKGPEEACSDDTIEVMAVEGLLRFPRDLRILTGRDYASVKRRGRRLTTRFFVLYVAPSETDNSRLGLIASKKVGNAVLRNRTKRVIREVFRINRHLLGGTFDIVVIAKRGGPYPSYGDYERDFLQGIAKIERSGSPRA